MHLNLNYLQVLICISWNPSKHHRRWWQKFHLHVVLEGFSWKKRKQLLRILSMRNPPQIRSSFVQCGDKGYTKDTTNPLYLALDTRAVGSTGPIKHQLMIQIAFFSWRFTSFIQLSSAGITLTTVQIPTCRADGIDGESGREGINSRVPEMQSKHFLCLYLLMTCICEEKKVGLL